MRAIRHNVGRVRNHFPTRPPCGIASDRVAVNSASSGRTETQRPHRAVASSPTAAAAVSFHSFVSQPSVRPTVVRLSPHLNTIDCGCNPALVACELKCAPADTYLHFVADNTVRMQCAEHANISLC